MMMSDDIIRMAREAGWTGIYSEWSSPTERTSIEVPVTMEQIERFAALVAAAEREECAKICQDIWQAKGDKFNIQTNVLKCAEAIRARGGQS